MPTYNGIDYLNLEEIAPGAITLSSEYIQSGFFSHVYKAKWIPADKQSKPHPKKHTRAVLLKIPIKQTELVLSSPPASMVPSPLSTPYAIAEAQAEAAANARKLKTHESMKKRSFESQKSIQNEIHIRTKLGEHPQIVKCIGMTTIYGGGLLFEYMHNNSLKQFQKTNILTESQGLQIGLDVSFALQYIHSKKIVYVDLSSDNVLINSYMHAKLCDFGGALQLEEGKSEFTEVYKSGEYPIQVKMPWRAPESGTDLLETGTFTLESDMYSFGTLLWHIFSRKEPFEAIFLHDGYGKMPQTQKMQLLNQHENEFDIKNTVVQKLALQSWSVNPKDRLGAQEASLILQDELTVIKKAEKNKKMELQLSSNSKKRTFPQIA